METRRRSGWPSATRSRWTSRRPACRETPSWRSSHGTARRHPRQRWSIDFPDPEGNRVELFVDTPRHTPQPFAERFDIEAPAEKIFAETEAICRSRPGFTSRAEWRKVVSEKMGAAG